MKKCLASIFLCALFFGCFEPAGRDNPLDPKSSRYSPNGSIKGYVGAYYQTGQPVSGASVFLYPSGNFITTGGDGTFTFNGLPAGIYMVKAVRSGYRSDSTEVMVNNDMREVQLQLNGIPVITRVMLSTHHISRWWPSDDLYYLTAAAEIDDPDGFADIDSVWMEVPAGQDAFVLERSGQNGTYEVSLAEQELSAPSLYYLQGKPIIVYCKDLLENIGQSGEMYIPRIIEETPSLVYPAGLEEVGSAPITFEWEPVFPGFSYTLKLEIYQINLGVYNKIHEFTQLPPGNRTFTYEQPLDPGDYFWVLYIIDDFGDSSRSKEGAFRVN